MIFFNDPYLTRDSVRAAASLNLLYFCAISFLASINFISSLFFCNIVVPTGRPAGLFELDVIVLLTLLKFDRRESLVFLTQTVFGGFLTTVSISITSCLLLYLMKALLSLFRVSHSFAGWTSFKSFARCLYGSLFPLTLYASYIPLHNSSNNAFLDTLRA